MWPAREGGGIAYYVSGRRGLVLYKVTPGITATDLVTLITTEEKVENYCVFA